MNELTRRGFLGRVAGAAAAATLPRTLRGAPAPAASPRPNVLFVMSDDMRVELGCYGSRFGAQTPSLDALAGAGVRFDRNYCQYPLCCPSRSSLLTGRHPTTTGVLGNRTHFRTLHPDWISLPQLFRENGYVSLRTGKIFHGGLDDLKAWTEGGGVAEGDGGAGGKTMIIPREQVGGRPDYVLPPLPLDTRQAAHSDRIVVLDGNGKGHPDYQTADRAIEYLRRYRDQPFFLGCGFVKPHSPPCAPQHFLDRYDVDQIKLTPDFAPWPTVPPGFPSAAIRKRNADLFIGRGASVVEAKQVIRAYLASISWADWNLGRVMAELDRLGLRERTIVVFTADHGYQLGEKGKWSKAGSLFEMGTRVPLLIAAPGAPGNGQVCYRIVESVNIYATLAELCGLPLPPGNEGRSLVPLLHDPRASWDHPAYSTWSEDGATFHGVAVRTAEWRYAEYGPEGRNGAMLFDPKADPLEMTNLAGDPRHAAVCAELAALTRRYAANLGKTPS
ncbi:MAG TPA: sulfatase [Opitutaceae bacterium]|nr:sulfatase [Opitutaceae bacterium]